MMSEKFTASNGLRVVLGPGRIDVTDNEGFGNTQYVGPDGIDALREFFLHERDQELGRWRWIDTSGDQYLVRKLNYNDGFRVTRESSMETLDWIPSEYQGDAFAGLGMVRAIHAYLDAHPEPKPWHDAKPGEVWEITYRSPRGSEISNRVMTCVDDGGDISFFNDYRLHTIYYTGIESARRIWPEVSGE